MTKSCTQCSAEFEITDNDLEFYDKVSPVFNGKKYVLPPPVYCPDCRSQRRLSHANERHLYKRTCDLTNQNIISIYHPDTPNTVYEATAWWTDKWDPLDYARVPDLHKPIFPQLAQLFFDVPVMSLFIDSDENSPYVNYAGWNKNCHLCFCTDHCENALYTQSVYYSKDIVDCYFCYNAEIAFECIDCKDCHSIKFSRSCSNCRDSSFLFDCSGCSNCYFCTGLRQKQYCWKNEQLTETEYKERLSTLKLSSHAFLDKEKKAFAEFLLTYPRKSMEGFNNENCTGNYLFNSSNALKCYDSIDVQDCSYCTNMKGATDCQDINYWGHPGTLCYDSFGIGEGMTNVLFSSCSWGGCVNLIHCINCISCSDCICCSGLRHKRYCIFNKQYSKEEYETFASALLNAMVQYGEWGYFLPTEYSPFGYNESPANDLYPLNKIEVAERNWNWRKEETEVPSVEKIIQGSDVPDSIKDIPDDVLNWAIACTNTKKPFKINKQELAFYRKYDIPLPKLHPDERYKLRVPLRNPRHLWNRQCAKCSKDIKTTYSPERPEIVYCEECYLKEVY